jgi:hypothetical protein
MTVAAATELWRMSATELAEAIRARPAPSVEVVDSHNRRTAPIDPR